MVYDVRSDAVIARARLSADGIDAWIAVDDEGGLNPGFFSRYGVRVIVRSEDLDDAYVSLGIERVCVPSQVADAMFKHAGWAYPEEACGLVAFDDGDVPRLTICLTNADHSADRFTVAPAEQFGSIRLAEAHGLTIGAVFHSHPTTEAYPSAEDIAGGCRSRVAPLHCGTRCRAATAPARLPYREGRRHRSERDGRAIESSSWRDLNTTVRRTVCSSGTSAPAFRHSRCSLSSSLSPSLPCGSFSVFSPSLPGRRGGRGGASQRTS